MHIAILVLATDSAPSFFKARFVRFLMMMMMMMMLMMMMMMMMSQKVLTTIFPFG